MAIYAFLIGSVLARLCAAIWIGSAMTFYAVSGALWIGAFLGFAILYGPALMKPKPAHG